MATSTQQETKVVLLGKLRSINEYQQLIFNLDESNANKLKELTKDITGNNPISAWTRPDGVKIYNLKVALRPQDKSVAKNFNAIAAKCGQQLVFAVEVCPYDFESKEGERVNGYRVVLITKLALASKLTSQE